MNKMIKEVEKLKSLVKMTAATEENEVSCEHAYRLLDQFAEAIIHGEDTAKMMPEVQKHLELCTDCREELDMLLKIIKKGPFRQTV